MMSTSANAIDMLENKNLWQTTSFINGKFTPESTDTWDVLNPGTGEVLAKCPKHGSVQTKEAIDAANEAWQSWKKTTVKERSKVIMKMYDLINKYRDDLATIMTLESGKPLAESKGELIYANSFYELYAEEAKRIHGETISPPMSNRRMMTIKQPVGPCALITPWNFPAAMITRKLGPALAAGCTAVIKPSEQTPLTALALCAIAQEAGVPPGVMNCVTVGRGEVVEVGETLCHSSKIRKLSFTGSTAVGKWLYRECAGTMKKLSMELGGNAPFIVFDDADMDKAVVALLNSKFRNTGQTCISSNRIFVQEAVYDEFARKLTEKVAKIRVGSGFDAANSAGPLIDINGLNKVDKQVQDCVSKGAAVAIGGKRMDELNNDGATFFQPTVLTGVTPAMAPYSEETFGPVAPLFSFKTEEEVIRMANDTPFGLAGYACTSSMARTFRVAEALEVGMVGINEGAISSDMIPFGGVKESGLGREGGAYGIEEYMETKYMCIGGIE
jgi:succinate-semialdehyde dehydrogenase/glutarate-semialdehyde dehydrogenase